MHKGLYLHGTTVAIVHLPPDGLILRELIISIELIVPHHLHHRLRYQISTHPIFDNTSNKSNPIMNPNLLAAELSNRGVEPRPSRRSIDESERSGLQITILQVAPSK
jgi:hypothetical protein